MFWILAARAKFLLPGFSIVQITVYFVLMTHYFPSRRDWALGCIVWLPLVLLLLPMMWDGIWPVVLFMLLIISFVRVVWFGTGYVLSEDELTVKIGPFVHSRLPMADIRYITRTDSWMASPANSLRRWRIAYGRWDEVIISPEREEAFFAFIRQRCPQVDIHLEKDYWPKRDASS